MSVKQSLSSNFQTQFEILVQETEKKREEIVRLGEIEKKLTVMGINISQRAAEALSGGQLEKLDQLVTIAEKVQAGKDRQEMEQYIQGLNTAVGSTEAQAVQLDGEVQKLDDTIAKMQKLVEERRKTLASAKKVAEEINQ